MATEIQLAVAGSGKTAEIARRIVKQDNITSIALTFTRCAQTEIENRLPDRLESKHETMGWFAFLVRHIVRPYLPKLYPGIIATGLCFVTSNADIPSYRSGWGYYLNDEHQPYSNRLALLAKQVLKASGHAPIRRLEMIFDKLYIDEFQDLGGNDLEILEAMMTSDIEIFITGDARQAVLATSRSDQLNREYRGTGVVKWFREKSAVGLCSVTYNDTTSRFNQDIADFSDLIHDPALQLPATTSTQAEVSGHDGIFIVDESNIQMYADSHRSRPTVLWSQKSKREVPEGELFTFGMSKGITRDRVIILATVPIEKWLTSKMLLAPSAASGFYVAVTRSRYSVALVTKNAKRLHEKLHQDFSRTVQLWSPP